MARSILGVKPVSTLQDTELRARSSVAPRLDGAALQARLRAKRSSTYLAAMTQLDAGGHVHDTATTTALIDAIRKELPDVQVEALPIGIVAKCYLGAPYEVHTLNCTGNIIQHYKAGASLPHDMERARSLACNANYLFIEVYADKLIAVSESGQTAIIGH